MTRLMRDEMRGKAQAVKGLATTPRRRLTFV